MNTEERERRGVGRVKRRKVGKGEENESREQGRIMKEGPRCPKKGRMDGRTEGHEKG